MGAAQSGATASHSPFSILTTKTKGKKQGDPLKRTFQASRLCFNVYLDRGIRLTLYFVVGPPDVIPLHAYTYQQAANLTGFRASEDPRFEAGIPDFMNGILNFSIHFNVVHRKVDWWNPKMKSLNSMPVSVFSALDENKIP